MKGHRPALRRLSLTSSLVAALGSDFRYSCASFASTVTARSLRLSPRTISLTVPLTGDARRMSAFFLSAITGEPASTLSPSFTRRRGVNPLSAVGSTATMPGDTVLERTDSAAPLTGMSSPFFKTMFLDIVRCIVCCCFAALLRAMARAYCERALACAHLTYEDSHFLGISFLPVKKNRIFSTGTPFNPPTRRENTAKPRRVTLKKPLPV